MRNCSLHRAAHIEPTLHRFLKRCRVGRDLRIPASGAAILLSLALLCARWLALDPTVELAARLLSPDGIVSAAGRSSFSAFLLQSAVVAAIAGMLLIASAIPRARRTLAAMVTWDALRLRGLAVPNPHGVLIWSSLLGLLVTGLWLLQGRLGSAAVALFSKEGPLEDLTYLLALASAALCGGAAVHWKAADRRSAQIVRALYVLCAAGLFVVAMEEINWGQTLVRFATPSSWADINYQQETSLHNLLDQASLDAATRAVCITFGTAFLLLIAAGARAPESVAGAVAPPSSLALLALITIYSGLRLHAEVFELLLALTFTFYGYRIYVAARSSAAARLPSLVLQSEPDVPLAGNAGEGRDDRRLWETELLEYTHDAIIIWEMGSRGIRYWNRAAEQLYGYTRGEALGRTTHELLRTELADGTQLLERRIARFGIWVGELRHTTRDGRQVDVQGRLALMSQQSGCWLVLEVNRDITDRKEAECARREMKRQLSELREQRLKNAVSRARA